MMAKVKRRKKKKQEKKKKKKKRKLNFNYLDFAHGLNKSVLCFSDESATLVIKIL